MVREVENFNSFPFGYSVRFRKRSSDTIYLAERPVNTRSGCWWRGWNIFYRIGGKRFREFERQRIDRVDKGG